MTLAALLIGFARAIFVVLEDGRIVDTIVHAMVTPLEGLPALASAIGMVGAHIAIHFPVPSVSGQAVLTMPVLVPLSDLLGLSRQVTVLAYQYGAGLTDMIIPTSGAPDGDPGHGEGPLRGLDPVGAALLRGADPAGSGGHRSRDRGWVVGGLPPGEREERPADCLRRPLLPPAQACPYACAFIRSRISVRSFSSADGSGGAAGAASSFFFILLKLLTTMKTAKATMRKETTALMKMP